MRGPSARIAVIYYSATGTVHRLAQAFVDGAADAGAEVRLRRVAELAGKLATGFTASYEEHGGQETTLLSLYQTFHHWGSIILPTGYVNYDVSHAAGGNPYGVSEVESRAGRDPAYVKAVQEAARHQGSRLAWTAAALVAARAGLQGEGTT